MLKNTSKRCHPVSAAICPSLPACSDPGSSPAAHTLLSEKVISHKPPPKGAKAGRVVLGEGESSCRCKLHKAHVIFRSASSRTGCVWSSPTALRPRLRDIAEPGPSSPSCHQLAGVCSETHSTGAGKLCESTTKLPLPRDGNLPPARSKSTIQNPARENPLSTSQTELRGRSG